MTNGKEVVLVCFRCDCRSVVSHSSAGSTGSFLFWSGLSHWLSWHTQTETLLVSLKAFSSPPVLLEATKHQLSWPAVTFSPLSVSRLSTRCTPSSPSLCSFQLADILIFPLLYLPSLHLHLFFSFFALAFTQNVYHVFSISRALFLARQIVQPLSCESVSVPANVRAYKYALPVDQVWTDLSCKALHLQSHTNMFVCFLAEI